MDIYSFNPAAVPIGCNRYKTKKLELAHQEIAVDTVGHTFNVSFPDIFKQYTNPPLTGNVSKNNAAYHNWISAPLKWWQNQLNFAIWCPTAGCGISIEHLTADGLLGTLYWFHFYYTVRRVLDELRTPLPTDYAYSFYDNHYESGAYERLCTEFGVDPKTDWRQRINPHWHGLRDYSQYMSPGDRYRVEHRAEGPFFSPTDKLEHHVDISSAWTTFIPDTASGFHASRRRGAQ